MKLLLAITLLLSPAQDPAPATFSAQSQLVLVPFHVARDKFYVSDLKASDVVLLEDGHPRPFTTFEAPDARKRTLELVLLFDSSFAAEGNSAWDLHRIYGFINEWNEAHSRRILEQGKADVLASAYRFDQSHLQRLCPANADPKALVAAFQQLLTPIPAAEALTLTLPPGSRIGPATQQGVPAWTNQAGIATLQQAVKTPDRVSRALVVFSRGMAEDSKNLSIAAVNLGVPIYPVVLQANFTSVRDAEGNRRNDIHIAQPWPQEPLRNLASATGGSYFDVFAIDANRMREILESVKNEVLSQYIVGFPPAAGTPKEHRLEVRVTSKSSGQVIDGKRTTNY